MLRPRIGMIVGLLAGWMFGGYAPPAELHGQVSDRVPARDWQQPARDWLQRQAMMKLAGERGLGQSNPSSLVERVCELNAPLDLISNRSADQESPPRQSPQSWNSAVVDFVEPVADSATTKPASSQEDECYTRIAALLVQAIRDQDGNQTLQEQTFVFAMKMITEQSRIASEQRAEHVKSEHRQTVAQLRLELENVKADSVVKKPDTKWMQDAFITQYRNTRQLQALVAANREMAKSMSQLERQVESLTLKQQVKLSENEMRQLMASLEADERKSQQAQEINGLESELKLLSQQLQQLKGSNGQVQRASLLEPAYMPSSGLRPIRPDSNR
jgi:hypothetical protein